MRRNYSNNEQEKIRKVFTNDELKENPKNIEGMLMGFHGRTLKYEEDRNIEKVFQSPSMAKPFGVAKKVYYDSDKRDPGSPQGDGRQGVNKRFVHDHDKKDVLIYELSNEELRSCFDNSSHKQYEKKSNAYKLPYEWPESCGWLGKLISIEYVGLEGHVEESFEDFDLFVWNDLKTLMAVPSRGLIYQALIWRGPDLKVNWRGIIH